MHFETIDTLTNNMAENLGLLSISQLCSLLKENGLDGDVIEVFRCNKIDGAVLLDLNKEDLKELGIVALGDQKKIEKIRSLHPPNEVSYLILLHSFDILGLSFEHCPAISVVYPARCTFRVLLLFSDYVLLFLSMHI